MGCDIHIAVEKKIKGNWVMVNWLGFSEWVHGRDRNYKRFAALAGVRGDGPTPLKLPIDVSPGTQFWVDKWDSDGHSHSYLDLKTACKVFNETHYDSIPSYPQNYFFDVGEEENIKDYRIVFFFDN